MKYFNSCPSLCELDFTLPIASKKVRLLQVKIQKKKKKKKKISIFFRFFFGAKLKHPKK
jgi:hypothetical protein